MLDPPFIVQQICFVCSYSKAIYHCAIRQYFRTAVCGSHTLSIFIRIGFKSSPECVHFHIDLVPFGRSVCMGSLTHTKFRKSRVRNRDERSNGYCIYRYKSICLYRFYACASKHILASIDTIHCSGKACLLDKTRDKTMTVLINTDLRTDTANDTPSQWPIETIHRHTGYERLQYLFTYTIRTYLYVMHIMLMYIYIHDVFYLPT